MVKVKKSKWSYPNTGLLFIIAGLAVGNYSYEKYQQKYLQKEKSSYQVQSDASFSDQLINEVRSKVEIVDPSNDVLNSLHKYSELDKDALYVGDDDDNSIEMDKTTGSVDQMHLNSNSQSYSSRKVYDGFNDDWEQKYVADGPNLSQIPNK